VNNKGTEPWELHTVPSYSSCVSTKRCAQFSEMLFDVDYPFLNKFSLLLAEIKKLSIRNYRVMKEDDVQQ